MWYHSFIFAFLSFAPVSRNTGGYRPHISQSTDLSCTPLQMLLDVVASFSCFHLHYFSAPMRAPKLSVRHVLSATYICSERVAPLVFHCGTGTEAEELAVALAVGRATELGGR